MRLFYECCLVEAGPDIPLKLISIGMINEAGDELYLINGDVAPMDIYRRPALREDVWPYLPLTHETVGVTNILEWDTSHPDYDKIRTREEIGLAVLGFVGDEPAELWNYFGNYDHVALCQLYGERADRPDVLPGFSNSIMQYVAQRDNQVPAPPVCHTARDVARWTRRCWLWHQRPRVEVL